jgi:hypothetical protein
MFLEIAIHLPDPQSACPVIAAAVLHSSAVAAAAAAHLLAGCQTSCLATETMLLDTA